MRNVVMTLVHLFSYYVCRKRNPHFYKYNIIRDYINYVILCLCYLILIQQFSFKVNHFSSTIKNEIYFGHNYCEYSDISYIKAVLYFPWGKYSLFILFFWFSMFKKFILKTTTENFWLYYLLTFSNSANENYKHLYLKQ